VLTTPGKADFRYAGGYAVHYDKTPDGCPAEVSQEAGDPETPQEPTYRQWQDIYDR
jgi:hypothetical protein